IYASIPGPDLVAKAKEVGIGNQVEGYAGAMVDDRFAPPLLLKGKVLAIKEGDSDAKTEVVVQIGSIKVIVTEKRKPYHHVKDFTDLNLDPENTDILVVKIG
ncbi:MAG TPA: microcystin degradation protein MlrC, partial [Algoriphagus sp.]|nr:microcystin degradation protein MlrC [Algoriphagus sp.]